MKEVLTRVGALVVAVGLVVGALWFRDVRDGGDGLTPPLGGGVELRCVEGLGDICTRVQLLDGVDAVREDVGAFEAALRTAGAAGEPEETSTWLVPVAWADLVDDERVRAGLEPLQRSEVVASTPIVMLVWADRGAVLSQRCGVPLEALTWGCVGDVADRDWDDLGGDVRWGRVVVGHAAPDTALGLQSTAAVVAGNLGPDYALRELQAPDFTAWFRAVEDAVGSYTPVGGSHLRAMVVTGPSVADIAVGTEAEVVALLTRETAFGAIEVVPALPLLSVDLVTVGVDEDAVEDAGRALTDAAARDAFDGTGWRVDGRPPTGSPVADLPPISPTPSGGVLTALRTVWEQVAR